MSLIASARHVVEHKQFVTIDADTGVIVPTPDAVYASSEIIDGIDDDDQSDMPENVVLLDGVTAQLIVQVYEALKPAGKAKFEALSPLKCVDVCWKLTRKAG